MKIEIKSATIERIEKMGGTLTDVAINKAIDIVEGKRDCPKPKLKLTGTQPIKAKINGKDVNNKKLGWSFILLELMRLAVKDKANLNRLGEIFSHPAVIEGKISDAQHRPIEGTNDSIRYMLNTSTGFSIIHGAKKLGYKLYIKYQWTNGKRGEIRVNC